MHNVLVTAWQKITQNSQKAQNNYYSVSSVYSV